MTEQFLCSRDIALDGRTVVLPAGGTVVWLEDLGPQAKISRLHLQYTATLGLSIGGDGTVYRQWHWLDNTGQVDFLRPGQAGPGEVLRRTQPKVLDFDLAVEDVVFHGQEGRVYVPGTKCSTQGGHLSFCSLSVRGQDVYRCRPEEGFGFCKHTLAGKPHSYAGCYPSIASPILVGDKAVYGGLDGALYVVPLAPSPAAPFSGKEDGTNRAWSFRTTLGKAISAPVAVCDGRVYFGSEDGYLYVLGPGGNAPLPSKDLELWKIRSPLRTAAAAPQNDRFTSFRDWGNTNADGQSIRLPLKLRWIRRYEGTSKQFSSFGGGRMYTHTAEGQVFAVEQDTGRLLWRRYFPGGSSNFTLGTNTTLNISVIIGSGFGVGYYKLIDYTSAGGTINVNSTFTLAGNQPSFFDYSVLKPGDTNYPSFFSGNALVLDVASKPLLTWSRGTGTWDTAALNWNGNTTAYVDGKDVVFDDTPGAAAYTVNISNSGAGVQPASVTFSNTSSGATYTFTGEGINGTTSLWRTGTGNNATLQSTGAAVDLGTNRTVSLGTGGGTIDVTGTNALTVSGIVSGAAGNALTKIGTGTLTLTGTNDYAGATAVSVGTLQARTTAALPGYGTAGRISVANSATWAVNVGGTGEWAAGDIDTLLTLSTSPFAAGSALGIDSTNAGSGGFTYAGTNIGANVVGGCRQ